VIGREKIVISHKLIYPKDGSSWFLRNKYCCAHVERTNYFML